ncbi:FHA domain-containing protein [Nocardioides sp. ChNu-153]|uniref:FHA domain-containing protein n=1 Tax=unclassified Nocardioides TaxID=2615069 RepID=UPI0024068548|nr:MULTISPECIES: FHA domain-containing protein [unclassified Nocardioides]MDF9717699.1 FHA domain-containing protein [Nocardioides sp. ChNu-99]MDN7121442.1 FHA domain-containing protein [Nocardioides sp. ChNu-153]
MTDEVAYDAGDRVLVGDGTRWLLVDLPFPPSGEDADLVRALWDHAGAPDAVERWVRLLERPSRALPDHAALDTGGATPRTATHGSGRAERRDGGWELRLGPAGGDTDPSGGFLRSGVTGARRARVRRAAPAAPPSPARPTGPAGDLIAAIPAEILAATGPAVPPGADLRAIDTSEPAGDPGLRGATSLRRSPRPPAAPGDHDGATVHRGADAHFHPSTAETVLGVRCVAGHATPPTSTTCRWCGAPVPESAPQRLPRPALGVLRLPTGELVPLDRGVLLGRRPVAPPGGDWPHLVHLPGDSTYLSRTHLQVQLDGWHVLVRDLSSRGGTTRYVPGRPGERLRPGEDYLLEPGHVLDLADVYEVHYQIHGEVPAGSGGGPQGEAR